MKNKTVHKNNIIKVIRYISLGIFLVSAVYLGYELILRPYISQKAVTEARNLYEASKEEIEKEESKNGDKSADSSITPSAEAASSDSAISASDSSSPADSDSLYDKEGRLKEFSALLSINSDVKGWLTIDGTNIDYPVLQSSKEDPEYYLHRNINRQTDKAGSIFLDVNSSVENNTRNMVLYGHNMKSSDNMFHYLIKYNDIDYYKQHSVITFNTLYQKGQWKIFSIFKADADINDDFFNFTRADFLDDADFLDFLYQLRVRSIYNLPVDLNEKDQIITLTTCSYELDNYRTIIVARKVRKNEDLQVPVENAAKNPSILYPASWYKNYGGTAPKTSSFKEALEAGQIDWYRKP